MPDEVECGSILFGIEGINVKIIIEKMKDEDWPEVKDIYQEGMNTGNATFESEAPDWEHWDKTHLRDCRLVAKSDSKIVGWAALSPVSNRCVYDGVAEVSLYVKDSFRRCGIGSALLKATIEKSQQKGIWTLQSMTFPENTASIALQKAYGFRLVGVREKMGCMNGRWRDVVLLERRSKEIGV